MGDRANVKIKESSGNSIYVYRHWGGYDMPLDLKHALEFARGRWNDESYCTRCLITKLTSADADRNTGSGVSTYPTDNERDVLEVESEALKVRLLDKDGWHEDGINWEKDRRQVLAEWTFEEYCALEETEDPWDMLAKQVSK